MLKTEKRRDQRSAASQMTRGPSDYSDDNRLIDVSDLFKIMGDPSRMRMIMALLEQEYCVHELAELIETSQSAVSHQLRIMRQARLVRYRRDGKHSYYSLQDDHVRQLVQLALDHVNELYAI
ncbi:MAG: metalloregulator ArsR/SmtB family transcription factor [Eubacteriales bacterium]|nr:metalloregulator ArsR/SmtB family transcription factor [Eubacteriales bacterium]MDD3866514.1 metalloregulator ArsR/SmtB family transcription factor [Eubacteriales bacterium]MDD4460707.1 metalloregulator ArsR/SmtB family transcription factor [Eubacteriales bacterium]